MMTKTSFKKSVSGPLSKRVLSLFREIEILAGKQNIPRNIVFNTPVKKNTKKQKVA
jgi:hypothetical protein